MRNNNGRAWWMGVIVGVVVILANTVPLAQAADGGQTFGGIEAGKWVLGMRAGFAPVTQTVSDAPGFRTSTDVGSLVNFQAMYSLNTWLLVGLMVEWERHAVDRERPLPIRDLGHQDTVSVLPTLELRPTRFGAISPYVNMSFGVNVNGFGEDRGVGRISPNNTFAWRLGWGADYLITKQLALNGEMAYKRNDGHATINGVRIDDWNASSFGFLVGVKLYF